MLSELKYFIFFFVLIIGVPFNLYMAKKYLKYEYFLWFIMLFFTVNMLDINFISMETYRGTSKGFEIGMVDISVFSLCALVISRRKTFPLELPSGSYLFFLYFFFSFISFINSDNLIYSSFEIWKMVRMYIFFFTVYNLVRSFKDLERIVKYISYIIIYVTFIVLKQKYLEGVFQTPGPFPHQNSLVMYMVCFGSLSLAYVLNRKGISFWYWITIFASSMVCVISTLSRGGMAVFMISIFIIFILSYAHKMSIRKFGIGFLFIILSTGILFKASDTIIERIQTAPKESLDVRIVLAQAATNMANDKFFGVGLNNFALKINPPYPYGRHIPRKDAYEKGGLVETIYLMIAAESGWHTLIIFLIMLFYFYIKNILNYISLKGSKYRYLPLAFIAALLCIYLQSSLEWVLKQTNNFYQLMLIFAIIAIISRLIKERRKRSEDK